MLLVLMALVVFAASAALDYSLAKYFKAVADKARLTASIWSVIVGAIGALTAFSMFKISMWLVVPELIGFFVGTYIAVGKRHA